MNPQDDLPGSGPTPPPVKAEPSFTAPAANTAAAAAVPRSLDHVIEQFASDYMKDRRSERRWRVFFRIMWFVLLLMLVLSFVNARRAANVPTGPHTALIEVRGEIAVDAEASAEHLVSALKTAFEDSGAQAIVLRINSPGGSPVQAGIINDEIRRLKAVHRKKVYAVVEEMCASGAYYIAVAADEIYTDKASIVGSIGVLMDGFGFTGAMEKLGIERRLYTAGENKGMNDPFSPENAKQREYTLAMIDQIHKQFIRVVKEGRGKRLKETADTFSGLYWNGEEAVKNGLADKLGNLDYVAREVVKAEEIIDYTPKENIAERLVKRFGASIGAGAVRALQGSIGLR
ncbi:S49 family peptidase [Piscinibacter sp. XHJ-5]|uniref:S49 family peptidase n=1 Tax=Piscinibacter sp. XHJ-5 TaxID=3037797 RepID=UPI0024529B14|nr:S49 family peptidase [Piscinibacter sp. XHJ-5]